MALQRRYGYVEGNNVRKIQPAVRPERRQRPQQQTQRRAKQDSVRYVNIFYTIFLVAAACIPARDHAGPLPLPMVQTSAAGED